MSSISEPQYLTLWSGQIRKQTASPSSLTFLIWILFAIQSKSKQWGWDSSLHQPHPWLAVMVCTLSVIASGLKYARKPAVGGWSRDLRNSESPPRNGKVFKYVHTHLIHLPLQSILNWMGTALYWPCLHETAFLGTEAGVFAKDQGPLRTFKARLEPPWSTCKKCSYTPRLHQQSERDSFSEKLTAGTERNHSIISVQNPPWTFHVESALVMLSLHQFVYRLTVP